MVQLFPLTTSYEEWITDAVEEHAQSRGLKSEIWHQNEAIWYIYGQDTDPRRIKSVQIIAFEAEDEPKLFFIPNISICDLGKRQMYTLPEVPSDSIRSVPVSILYNKKKRDECIELIREKISEAWSETERLGKTGKLTVFSLPANKLV